MNASMDERFKDILGLPHHVSAKRKAMSEWKRAAQFAPFAALTGHEEAIEEAERLHEEEME